MILSLALENNTDSPFSIAGPSIGGDIGKERERREEQEEHARRMNRKVEDMELTSQIPSSHVARLWYMYISQTKL